MKHLQVKVTRIEQHDPTVFRLGTEPAEMVTFQPTAFSVDGIVEAVYPAGTWHIGDTTQVQIGVSSPEPTTIESENV